MSLIPSPHIWFQVSFKELDPPLQTAFVSINKISVISICNIWVYTSKWGDQVKAFDKECDSLNNTLNSGCDLNCKIESGYYWEVASSNVYSTWATKCGDGVVAGSEKLDYKNFNNGDGCSSWWWM